MQLDALSIEQCLRVINEEDATVAGAVAKAIPQMAEFIAAAERCLRDRGRLIYLGAGTSGRLGVLDAAECPPTFRTSPTLVQGIIAGGDEALRKSSEGAEDEYGGAHEALREIELGPMDAVLGIAAGGTTPYVLGGLWMSKGTGCTTGLLTCAPVERPAFVDHLIVVETGPEVVTGSTRMKAGTATKLVLNSISTTLMVRMGKVYENLMVDVRASNDKLRDRAARIVMELTGLEREAAFDLLERAGRHVKTAVLMHRKSLSREKAEAALARHGDSLRAALEE